MAPRSLIMERARDRSQTHYSGHSIFAFGPLRVSREWPLSRTLADDRERAFTFLHAPAKQRACLSKITIR
jgi:hypothetical protein